MKNVFCKLLLMMAGLCLGHSASAQIAGAAWESVKKEAHANAGDTNALLTFAFTNTSSSVISIERVTPSCGCTIMKLPDLPWKIAPNAVAKIPADIDLRGKHGVLAKTITIDTSAGNEKLSFKVMIPLTAGASQRQANQMLAAADRQAVFKGDCAKCHAEPAKGKMGAELYQAVCAICHDSNDLAVMVPDLKFIKYASDDMGFWERWMLKGREDSLMPMFGQKEGGPLTDEQIASLAKFLEKQFPPEKQ